MKLKNILTTVLFVAISLSVYAQNERITTQEFQQVVGKWIGKLVYLDYKSNQPYEMPADLEIIQIDKSNKFKFVKSYPNESSANSTDTLSIKDNGTRIDSELIKAKRNLPDGNLELVTEIQGKDGNDNKPALIKHVYLIGSKVFEIRKEVQFAGTTDWILRHTFSYSRK